MSSGNAAFTKDARFSLLHQPGDTDWTLGIKYLQQRDEGTYVCQVSNIIFYNVNIYDENTFLYYSDYDQLNSVSLKIEPLQYIAIYCNGSIFNETDFTFQIE